MKNRLITTDQIRCYDPSGHEIPCRGTGQDASRKKDERLLSICGERFQSKGERVVDRLTGHVWTQDANPARFPLSWQEAIEFVAEMNANATAGFSNWQLPDRSALFSLISHQHVNPSLPLRHPFKNVFPGYYWTRDTCSRLPNQAWYVHLGGGRVFRGMKHGACLAWPMIPETNENVTNSRRFASAPPLILDRQNNATWLLDHPYLNGPRSWQKALEGIRSINREKPFGDHRWYLPNIRELESPVNLQIHSPAIFEDGLFSGIQDQSGYWSSTTSVYEPRYAWVLYPRDGEVGVGFKRNADFSAIGLTDCLLESSSSQQ